MKNIDKIQRIALCVHIDLTGHISEIYKWALPDEIKNIPIGAFLKVENLSSTKDVVFIAETLEYTCPERKKVLSSVNSTLKEWAENTVRCDTNRIIREFWTLARVFHSCKDLEDYASIHRKACVAERKERKEQQERRAEAIIRIRSARRALREREEMKSQSEEQKDDDVVAEYEY